MDTPLKCSELLPQQGFLSWNTLGATTLSNIIKNINPFQL
jgi:hypothetical protein